MRRVKHGFGCQTGFKDYVERERTDILRKHELSTVGKAA